MVSTLVIQTNLGSFFLIIFLNSLSSLQRTWGQEVRGSTRPLCSSVPREICSMLLTGLLIVQVMVNLETFQCLALQRVAFWVG